jgi:hypothetical protein
VRHKLNRRERFAVSGSNKTNNGPPQGYASPAHKASLYAIVRQVVIAMDATGSGDSLRDRLQTP